MASTPSASALTSVLRCRGSLWTRNPPSKRSSPSAYGPALAGGTRRDSSGRGESFLATYRLSARYESPPREDSGAHLMRDPRRGVPEADAYSAAPRGLDASTRRPGGARKPAARVGVTRLLRPCQIKVFVRDACEQHKCGVLGVCRDDGEVTPSFVEIRWGTLWSTCRSLQLLLTHVVLPRLAMLCGCARGRHRKIKRDDSRQLVPKSGPD